MQNATKFTAVNFNKSECAMQRGDKKIWKHNWKVIWKAITVNHFHSDESLCNFISTLSTQGFRKKKAKATRQNLTNKRVAFIQVIHCRWLEKRRPNKCLSLWHNFIVKLSFSWLHSITDQIDLSRQMFSSSYEMKIREVILHKVR